ncbi:hypothetical protein FNL55_07250 [Tardiphaga sp. vice352]|uniref:DUF5681 domain-containing protein n=1 Tax=unclassified Tardiphaga TaxID=2631404 RepID=UPI0011656337|nr:MULTISPECIES: DUF5681 domain-containing protein [unclassified Tardiphaga]QDM15786.1 hypothetical protein FNL53_07535 [Tardiphaga sp. vice278]QDM20884.1 hypothetical protein FIU28_06895 [Tardiphaga sp. vice154]QDM25982.1 hypothetical protein FNL56_07595 [Tardiphaga sp. vice304]QDM31128.1 hypothetical protein FNL55_07250 [Tardiphaga sp. vice352]
MKKKGSRTPPTSSDYEVGYGKPPKDHQFKPGKSPNPNGRPKGAKNKDPAPDDLAQIFEEEGARFMAVKDNGKETSMPTARVIVRKLNRQAASGDTRAQKIALEGLSLAQERRAKKKAERFALAVEYKMSWEKRFTEAGTRRLKLPPGCPHPDTIVLDFEKEEYACISTTPDEDELLSLMLSLLKWWQTMMNDILASDTSDTDLRDTHEELKFVWKMIGTISRSLGLPWDIDFRSEVDDDRIKALKTKLLGKK